eukprot:TRINITY_DN14266_c0_g1_i3.p1 TRINITY_DN14266_c0_g1~~TRINITY_DN14266_c0_g1_i3.p1  ORF type:complete len:209 (-),score=25.32 TRINITY_DN14266_c0_g1_i3:83-709(-)
MPFLAKTRGSIVNISCQYGSRPAAGLLSYCMSKAGLECLTRALALELGPFGVRVNAVSPSFTETNLLYYRGVSESDVKSISERLKKKTPLGRVSTVQDVANAIIFLASNYARHITGQILKIDGGRSLTSSGYNHWQGTLRMPLVIESPKPTIIKNISSYFKVTDPEKETDPRERVNSYIKSTYFGTTSRFAHVAIKEAVYDEVIPNLH